MLQLSSSISQTQAQILYHKRWATRVSGDQLIAIRAC